MTKRKLVKSKSSGALRDMQEAATLSPEFSSLLQTYQTQARTGYDAMRAEVDGVIDGWVGSSANREYWRIAA